MSSQPGQRRLRGAVMGFACLISLPGAALQPRQGPREAVLLECASDGAGRCREVTATLPPDARKRGLNAVWGDGKGTIYIAGNAGTLLAWDGSKWTSVDSGVRDG